MARDRTVAPLEVIIEGRRESRLTRALAELWSYRALVLAFTERDVRVRYKQAVLGIAWAVLQPLAVMGIFTLALGRLARVPGGGVPYAAFSLSAVVAWSLVQTGVTNGANALITDASLLRKVYFPREVPVIAVQLSAVLDFGAGLALFAALGPILGARVSPTWLFAPLLGIGLVGLSTGASLVFSALNVYYRDFRYAVPFLLQLWLFASPVAYPLTVVPERWQLAYAALNPAAGLLDGFRRAMALGQSPDAALVGVSLATVAALLLIGYRLFKRLELHVADVV